MATISYPDEISSAAQAVRFTVSDPSNHGWWLYWNDATTFISGGAVISGDASKNGDVQIEGTGDAVLTLSVVANTSGYGRWIGTNPYMIYFHDETASGYTSVSFYQND
jgi:hypothetical protein